MQVPQANFQEECVQQLRRLSIGSKIFSDSSSMEDEATPDIVIDEEGMSPDIIPRDTSIKRYLLILLFYLSLITSSLRFLRKTSKLEMCLVLEALIMCENCESLWGNSGRDEIALDLH